MIGVPIVIPEPDAYAKGTGDWEASGMIPKLICNYFQSRGVLVIRSRRPRF